MIEVNPSRFKFKPYAHQLAGVKTLLKKPIYGLFWKMRLGKTKAIIDTACILFEAGVIDTLLVVGPKQVTDIWLDKNLGEIVTHNWSKARPYEYKEYRSLFLPDFQPCYVVAGVEFLRQQGPRDDFPYVNDLLAALRGRKVWFVFDEGSVLGNWSSQQTKAMIDLRNGDVIGRVSLLDGTPRGNSHLTFYSKFKFLDKAILACKSFYHFRAKFSETTKKAHQWKRDGAGNFLLNDKGNRIPERTHVVVVSEKNQEEFARRTAPFCEFLEQDVLDMPKKVPGILTAKLDEKAWGVYCQMRDELVAEIDSGVCAVSHAAVKCIRLAQICAGFLGGVQEHTQQQFEGMLDDAGILWRGDYAAPITKEIHDAPTKMLMGWLKLKLEEDKDFKAVIWCRFVPEIVRLSLEMMKVLSTFEYGVKSSETDTYENQLHPRSKYQGPYILVCQPQTAQYGNNFSRARTSIFLSQDYNRVTRAQAGDRVQADGAGATTLELDVLVTGPRGQKTIVHDIVASVRGKEEAEKRTAQAWKKVLMEE